MSFKVLKLNAKSTHQNPYVLGSQGRREWNDRYFNMRHNIQLWQRAFFAAMGLALVFGGILAYFASTSKITPFVVETNQGMPYAIKPMDAWGAHDQRIINFAVNQFIINAKTIVNDSEAEKALLNKVYAFSADSTLKTLQDYYEAHDPFTEGSHFAVVVHIVNSMPISAHTFQVSWDEIRRDLTSGAVVEKSRWLANVSYKFGAVNSAFMNDNPFGIYVTQVSWSKSNVN